MAEFDELEPFRREIRAAGFKVNPYRMGRAMGRAYHAKFWAWSAEANANRDFSGRPSEPKSPYENRASAQMWLEGFRFETRQPRPKAKEA